MPNTNSVRHRDKPVDLSTGAGAWALDFEAILGRLNLAVLVFDGPKVIFRNGFTKTLEQLVHEEHGAELLVVLRAYVLNLIADHRVAQGLSIVKMPKGGHLTMEFSRLDEMRMLVCLRWPGRQAAAIARHYDLSPREFEVAVLVLRGLSNRTIAQALSITSDTVKKHMTKVFDKVGVDSRLQLMSLIG